jgi:Lhr-like helicase
MARPKIIFLTVYCLSKGSDTLDARVELPDVGASVELRKENIGAQAEVKVDGASVSDSEVLVNGLLQKIIKLIKRDNTKIITVNDRTIFSEYFAQVWKFFVPLLHPGISWHN